MAILTNEVLTKIAPHKDKFLAIHPNNEKLGDEITGTPKYTDTEWINEYIKRHLIEQIKRGQAVLHRDALALDDVDLD